MVDKSKIEKIKQSLIQAIQAIGKTGFQLTQLYVPVISGKLKRSGSENEIENGVSIEYKESYASFPERGTRAGTRFVHSYTRKDGTRVKSFSYFSSGQKAQKYIYRGLSETFQKDFANNMERELRKISKKVSRT